MTQKYIWGLGGLILILMGLFYMARLDRLQGNDVPRNNLPAESPATLPTYASLQERLYEDRTVLLIYGASHPGYAGRYRTFAEKLQERSRRIRFRIQSDKETQLDDMKGVTVYLIGSARANAHIPALPPGLPLSVTEKGLRLFDTNYRDSSDVLTLFYPSPLDSTYGLYVITGNSDEALLTALNDNSRQMLQVSGGYRVYRNRQLSVLGFFTQDEQPWRFNPATHRDFGKETRLVTHPTHYQYYLHNIDLTPAEMDALDRRLQSRLVELQSFLGRQDDKNFIDYHIYASCEDKGLTTGNTSLAHFDTQRNAVYAVIDDGMRGDTFLPDARLTLQRTLGISAFLALETGLAAYFSENWHDKGYAYWAARLHESGNGVPLDDLLDDALFQAESELVMTPMAGTLVGFLIDRQGKDWLLANYRSWKPEPTEKRALEKEWRTYLDALSERFGPAIARDRSQFPQSERFQKGFCYAHEGYQIYNGYISRKSDESLAKLSALSVNAISITPFSYMRDPQKPVFLRFSQGAGSENDECVIYAAQTAHSLGMDVMLKPHIWLGRSWPGDIAMQSDSDWETFFGYYHRWMRHYALLAEMYQMELLCIGVEMAQTTASQDKRWRALIQQLRGLYSGQMTYAANWGNDFENVTFWDALDFIGLNSYYTLSSDETPTDNALRKGVQTVIRRVENVYQRYKKPVIFTEIGFTSTPTPWHEPHLSAGGKSVDLAAQARCYEAIYSELYRQDWLAGIYWWKWPTYLEYGGSRDNDFTPNNKPAEAIVSRYYRQNR